jgi:hypothetical protein
LRLFFSMQLLFGMVVFVPLQHNSFSSLTSPLVCNGVPPIFHWRCSYSSSTLFFILLLLDVIHVFPWHYSSSYSPLTPFLLHNNVPPLALSWWRIPKFLVGLTWGSKCVELWCCYTILHPKPNLSWLELILHPFGVGTSHGRPWIHLT